MNTEHDSSRVDVVAFWPTIQPYKYKNKIRILLINLNIFSFLQEYNRFNFGNLNL